MRTVALLFLVGCGSSPVAPVPAPEPVLDPAADEQALKGVEATIGGVAAKMKDKLQTTMKAEGPVAAVGVCQAAVDGVRNDPTLTGIGRSSLRLRNPKNTGPDWVMAWLNAQGEVEAGGVTGVREVVEVDGERRARVIKPIAVEGPCVICHGPPDGMAPELKEKIASLYPEDRATGYDVGDLRGAFWGERVVSAKP